MTTPAQPELKPCPSCGSTQIHDGTRGMTVASKRVQCLQCGMQAPSRDTWNRRATEPAGSCAKLSRALAWAVGVIEHGLENEEFACLLTDLERVKELLAGAEPSGAIGGDALRTALAELLEEYEDRKSQFGSDYYWTKHEAPEVVERAKAALNATEPTDLDRAWAWVRENRLTIREYPHGAYWAVLDGDRQVGTGPTNNAAVLSSWRVAMGKEGQG